MSKHVPVVVPAVPGIDLSFRPRTYFGHGRAYYEARIEAWFDSNYPLKSEQDEAN